MHEIPANLKAASHETIIRMIGAWRDRIYKHGRLVKDTGWVPNQVQNTNAILLASLCKNRSGYDGFQYFALGEGLASWDSSPPSQPYSDTTLTSEVFRKSIPVPTITFRHPITGALSATQTNVIQVDVTIGTGEANGYALREFAVFGGNATVVVDSGLMVDWITHARIDKNSSISIDRSVKFTYEVN